MFVPIHLAVKLDVQELTLLFLELNTLVVVCAWFTVKNLFSSLNKYRLYFLCFLISYAYQQEKLNMNVDLMVAYASAYTILIIIIIISEAGGRAFSIVRVIIIDYR